MAFLNNRNLAALWKPSPIKTQTAGSLSSKISSTKGSAAGVSGGNTPLSGLHNEDYYYKREKADILAAEKRAQADRLAQITAQQKTVPTTTTSTMTQVLPSWIPPSAYDVPEYQPYIPGAAPTYAAPTWDEGAIESLTQRNAASGLRGLREQVQRVTGRKYENAQVGRMTLREALQGYGAGMGSVLSAAGGTARGEYSQKYGIEADVAKTNYGGAMTQWGAENVARSQGAMTNYQAELEKQKAGFESAWNKWKAGIGTTTTNKTV